MSSGIIYHPTIIKRLLELRTDASMRRYLKDLGCTRSEQNFLISECHLKLNFSASEEPLGGTGDF